MSIRNKWAAAALALCLGATGAVALANDGGRGFHGRGGPWMGRMFQELNLTDAQRQQFQSIMEDQRKVTEPQREQIRDLHQQIRQQLDSGQADATQVGQLTIQMHTLGQQLRASHEQARAKFEALLTPEQKAKLDQLKQEHEQRGFRRGPRPDGEDGPEMEPPSSF